MNWVIGILLDVILVAVALLCIRKGSKDGFAKTVVSFFGIFIAIILAVSLSKPIANYAYTNFAQKPIENAIESSIGAELDKASESDPSAQELLLGVEGAIEKLPEFINNSLKTEEKQAEISDHIVKLYTTNVSEFSHNITETVVKPILISILAVAVFVIVFLVVFIVCVILSKALKIVNKLPLLGGVNSLLGGIIGFLKGLIIVLIINYVIVSLTSSGTNIFGVITAETVHSSLIMKNLALVNPLNSLLASVLGTK